MNTSTSSNRHSGGINDKIANLSKKVVLDFVSKECERGERCDKLDSYTNLHHRLHKDPNRLKQCP